MENSHGNGAALVTVLHLITGLGAGGAERQLAALATRSDPARIRHVVVSLLDAGNWGPRLREAGIELHTLDLKRKWMAPLALPRLASLVRSIRGDIIQTWLYHADLLGLVTGTLTGRPVIWTLRSSHLRLDIYGLETQLLVRLLTRLSGCPRAVVANAAAGESWHRSIGYRARRWVVIPNGVDTGAFHPDPAARAAVRQELGLPDDAKLIGNVSRHDPMKDHPTLLAAFRALAGRAWLLLAGDGASLDNPILARQIVEAGIVPDRVLRLGQRSDVPRLLAALDVAVLSSAFGEGFPNVVAEGMACGIPSIATDIGDAAQIIGDCGVAVPITDPAALGAGIAKLLDLDPAARADLAQRSRARIEQEFSIPAMIAAYSRLYDEILTKRKV